MKLLACTLILVLSGCQMILGITKEQEEISKLEPAERCNRIHIDLRKQCREDLVNKQKETNELAKAMKKDRYNK